MQENNWKQIKTHAAYYYSSRVLFFQNVVQKELNVFSVFWGMLEDEMLSCRRKEIPG